MPLSEAAAAAICSMASDYILKLQTLKDKIEQLPDILAEADQITITREVWELLMEIKKAV